MSGIRRSFFALAFLSQATVAAAAARQVPADYLDGVPGAFSSALRSYALERYDAPVNATFSASMHGLLREMTQYRVIRERYSTPEIETSYLREGGLEVQLHVAREGRRARRAPMAVVLNPIFGENGFAQMNRFIQFFGERGFHVLVFQSTFTDSVSRKAPAFFPGDLREEARMHRDVLRAVVRERIGEDRVSGATLVGLSYGAFLSAVIKAEDAASARPLFNGPVLLINPPYDILHSSRNVDRYADEARADGDMRCLATLDFTRMLAHGLLDPDTNRVTFDERCAKAFLSVIGFQGRLRHVVRGLNRSNRLGLSAGEIDGLSFTRYIQEVARVPVSGGISELGYWMKRARERGFGSFLILGSQDDFINAGYDFERSATGRPAADHFIELPSGGHTGLRSARSTDPGCRGGEWFGCVLERLYP